MGKFKHLALFFPVLNEDGIAVFARTYVLRRRIDIFQV